MMLGNLSIKQIQERTGVDFPKELIEYMEVRHQSKAEGVLSGQWHCFDIPFTLLCGDMETAQNIYDYLKPLTNDFKQQMQISIRSSK